MSTRTNHKRTRLIALVTALLVVAGILGLAPKAGYAANKGTLTVSKTLQGAEAGDTTEFGFTLELTVPATATLPETLTYKTKDNTNATAALKTKAENVGTYTFNLKGSESATFDLDVESKVKVTETEAEGWTSAAQVQIGRQAEARDMTAGESLTITNEPVTVTVTNTKDTEEETGKLTVSKTIEGADTDALKATEFNFKIDLKKDDADINGVYSYTGSKSGNVRPGESISLKGGESVTIEGIPANTAYTVTETAVDKWTTTKTGDTGIISKDATATAAFTNTYKAPGTGDLKITKTVVTDYLDKAIAAYTEAYDKTKEEKYKTTLDSLKETLSEAQAQKFTFTVKLTDKNDKELTGEYDYTGKVGGESVTDKKIKSGDTVELAHDDTITITGLDADTKYTVTETEVSGYQVDKATQDGTISSNGAADATFKNTPVGGLVIKKNIQSRSGNDLSDALKEQEFTFTVNYRLPEYDSDSEAIVYKDIEEEEFAYTGDRSGKIKSGDTITLKGGESVTFSGLQVGMNARVEETPVTNWQASAKALSGDIRLNKNRTATFTNTYQDSTGSSSTSTTPRTSTTTTRTSTPATSDDTNVAVPIVLGALAVGLVVVGRVARSKE